MRTGGQRAGLTSRRVLRRSEKTAETIGRFPALVQAPPAERHARAPAGVCTRW
jgi:hypothetical protein